MIKYVYIAIAVILIVVVYGYITTDRRSDEEKITEVVSKIVSGANSRNLSRCMSNVSNDFIAESDINKDRLRLMVAQAFRSETNFHLETTIRNLTVSGDEAQAVVYVVITGWEGNSTYQKDVNVTFKREKSRRLLVIPTNNWKVTFVDSLVVSGGEELF